MELMDLALKYDIRIVLTGRAVILRKYYLVNGQTNIFSRAYSLYDLETINDFELLINLFLEEFRKEIQL